MTDANHERIRAAAAAVAVMDHLSYREYLKAVFDRVRAEDDHYSLLQFAEDLGFSRSNFLSRILSGRRKLTRKSAVRMQAVLQLNARDRRYLLGLVDFNNTRLSEDRAELLRKLSEQRGQSLDEPTQRQTLDYFSEWYHPVIREMTRLPDFSSDPAWIASRLYGKVLPQQVEKSLELLQSLGLIRHDAALDRLVQAEEQIRPDRAVSNMALVRYHQAMLSMASDAVTQTPKTEREINAITVCLSEGSVEELRQLLLETCHKIMAIEERCKDTDRVVQVNLQMFPITKAS